MASLTGIIFLLSIPCCIHSAIPTGPKRPFQYASRYHHPPVLTRPKPQPVVTTTTPVDTPEPDTEVEGTTPSYNSYDYNYNYNDYNNFNFFGGYNGYDTYGGRQNHVNRPPATSSWGGGYNPPYTVPATNPPPTTPDPPEVEENQSQVTHGHCFCSVYSTCPRGAIPRPRPGECGGLFSFFIPRNYTRCCYRPSVAKSMPIAD